MSQEQDQLFFRNFAIVLVLLSLLMVTFMALGLVFGGQQESADKKIAMVVKNTAPVGNVQLEGDEPIETIEETSQEMVATEESSVDIGQSTYEGICVACHGGGIPIIPQLGDVAAWESRIAKGNDILYENAIIGYIGDVGMPMPAKGGNPALSDEAVKAAVDYMVNNSQ